MQRQVSRHYNVYYMRRKQPPTENSNLLDRISIFFFDFLKFSEIFLAVVRYSEYVLEKWYQL